MKYLNSFIRAILAALPAMAILAMADEVPPGALEKITQAIPRQNIAKPSQARRLLVVSTTHGFRHQSIPTGKLMLAEIERITGAFTAVIDNDLQHFESDALEKFDAVCFLNTTGNIFLPTAKEFESLDESQKKDAIEREQRLKKNLLRYIRDGGGFIGIHAATDTFHEWPEFGEMINGFFDGHPWTAGSKVSIRVEPGKSNHPLVAMFQNENLRITEEIYQFKDPYHSRSVEMLLRIDTENTPMDVKGINRKDNDFGVSWIRHWGNGRVFYTSLGHNHEIYWHPMVVQHYLAGIQWALGDLNIDVAKP
ncbi:MAG: ThuA domain-containing protein [Luteolibacter sp.]